MNCTSTTRSTICPMQLPLANSCSSCPEPVTLAQFHGPELLVMLFRTEADPLQDGSFQVIEDQEVLDWKGCHLHFPREQWGQAHRPVGSRPLTCLCNLLKKIHKSLRIVLWTHLGQRRGWRG